MSIFEILLKSLLGLEILTFPFTFKPFFFFLLFEGAGLGKSVGLVLMWEGKRGRGNALFLGFFLLSFLSTVGLFVLLPLFLFLFFSHEPLEAFLCNLFRRASVYRLFNEKTLLCLRKTEKR